MLTSLGLISATADVKEGVMVVVVTVHELLSPASPSPLPSPVDCAASAVPESSTIEVKSTPVRSWLVGASESNNTVILLLAVILVLRSTLIVLPAVLFV